ncbi:MAG: DUF1800 family protein, partial [Verrucomicrobiota bacterium]
MPRFSISLFLILVNLNTGLAAPPTFGLDLNGDGLSDPWQVLFGEAISHSQADPDGDGANNAEEAIAGTDPFDASSRLAIESFQMNEARTELALSWAAVPGKRYQIETSTDLRSWTPVGTPVDDAADAIIEFGEPMPNRIFCQLTVADRDADLDGLNAYEEALLGFSDTNRHSSGTSAGNDFVAALNLFGTTGSFNLQGRTVNGRPPSLAESSRFLQQATMGSTYSTIQGVPSSGISTWLERQFAIPATSHVATNNRLSYPLVDEDIDEEFTLSFYIWTWWDAAMNGPDTLRQRVAFALSEIFVIGQTTDELEDFYWGVATYYDILVNNAFGNYRDLLFQITTNPAMGHYLSHVKNRPTDPTNNIFPDENYAREIMQLFSIGLFEPNPDGSRKKDVQGNDIPTYDNTDITNFARVFTGLTYNPQNPNNGTPYFGDEDLETIRNTEEYLAAPAEWMGIAMLGYEPMHETGPKPLLNGQTTNGTLQQDLDAAIDNLFNHPNVGPFLGRLLIQRLVTSNPSPAYISRVAAAFDDNGSGVRGDMKAVIRAILLDPEARNRSMIDRPHFGKLREPVLRHTHIARAFNYRSSTGNFVVDHYDAREAYAQQPMLAPSVFNFYLPDHQPLGAIKDAGLVAPEFQITTATTTIKTLNFYSQALPFDFLLPLDDEAQPGAETLNDFDAEEDLLIAGDVSGLVDRLDILLTRGQMSPSTRTALTTAVSGALANGADPFDVARFA